MGGVIDIIGAPGVGKTTLLEASGLPHERWAGYADEWKIGRDWQAFADATDAMMRESAHPMARRFHREIRASINRVPGLKPGAIVDEGVGQRVTSVALAFAYDEAKARAMVERFVEAMPSPAAIVEVTAPLQDVQLRNKRRRGLDFSRHAALMIEAAGMVSAAMRARGVPVIGIEARDPVRVVAAELRGMVNAMREQAE